MIELHEDQPIFVGFKLETSLRRQLQSLEGPDKKYVSEDDSTFLRICRLGDAYYVGKLIDERLTTERIDDIKRNIFSIMQRLCPEERLPKQMEILAAPQASAAESGPALEGGETAARREGGQSW